MHLSNDRIRCYSASCHTATYASSITTLALEKWTATGCYSVWWKWKRRAEEEQKGHRFRLQLCASAAVRNSKKWRRFKATTAPLSRSVPASHLGKRGGGVFGGVVCGEKEEEEEEASRGGSRRRINM